MLNIKIIRKGEQFTEDEISSLKANVNEAIASNGGLEKLPVDENGNRLMEIDVNGEKVPVVVGTENSLNELGEVKVIVDIALSDFITKPLKDKLSLIADSWKKYYPQIFIERTWFEDLMGYYRYTPNAGWNHTTYIADNFKAIDFYKKASEVGNNIFAETIVSMKTTTTKNVDDWLATNAVIKNIDNLKKGLETGIEWNGKNIQFKKAEIHIYMPGENITGELKTKWLTTLKSNHPEVNFEINSLDEFITK